MLIKGGGWGRLLDWRLRRLLRKHDLPDLPEVRKMLRLAWWNGFTSVFRGGIGAFERQEAVAYQAAMEALRRVLSRGRLALACLFPFR